MSKNTFNYSLDFGAVDFRRQPALYRIGVGEQGVLLVQPYKSEILPHWRFRTETLATESAKTIYGLFEGYLEAGDFVGADMARKFLQMGFTRARRYANHSSGRKYELGEGQSARELPYPYSSGSKNKGGSIRPQEGDALTGEKARAAEVFRRYWFRAKDNPEYLRQKERFKQLYYSR